ncbi:hypothetical protein [Pedobacter jamesrossensis]|uniref:Uncharacterized protein n=1 Tax=Pedobacter jamesrossensis TaxID=1908238 RepID=A0ABV8NL73_9SPHI
MITHGYFDNQELGNPETDISFPNGILSAYNINRFKSNVGQSTDNRIRIFLFRLVLWVIGASKLESN